MIYRITELGGLKEILGSSGPTSAPEGPPRSGCMDPLPGGLLRYQGRRLKKNAKVFLNVSCLKPRMMSTLRAQVRDNRA